MTHSVKNFGLDNLLGNHAKSQFKLWHFSKEWRIGIILLVILKLFTMVVSIYAGYYFLYNISLPVLKSHQTTTIAAVIILLIIELLTMFFLQKFFKFLLKGIIITSVFAGIIAATIYIVSFHISTNGLAMRQSNKVDNSTEIITNSTLKANNLKKDYQAQIKELDNQITLIKINPQGWQNGRRVILTEKQLDDIDSISFEKYQLRQELKTELVKIDQVKNYQISENKRAQTAEADKYYKYVVAIMIAQLFANGLLMFAWSRIYTENDRLQGVNEDIAKAENAIISNFFNHIANRLFEEANNIQLSIENQKQIPFEITNTEQIQQPAAETETQIGFRQNPKPAETKLNSQILGKLRTNDMLRYVLKKKAEGDLNWTESRIKKECEVKKWKIYEFKNLMISAGLINEPNKYKNYGN